MLEFNKALVRKRLSRRLIANFSAFTVKNFVSVPRSAAINILPCYWLSCFIHWSICVRRGIYSRLCNRNWIEKRALYTAQRFSPHVQPRRISYQCHPTFALSSVAAWLLLSGWFWFLLPVGKVTGVWIEIDFKKGLNEPEKLWKFLKIFRIRWRGWDNAFTRDAPGNSRKYIKNPSKSQALGLLDTFQLKSEVNGFKSGWENQLLLLTVQE